MPSQMELEARSRSVREARDREQAAAALQAGQRRESSNRHKADLVLAELDALLSTAADRGDPWVVVWQTSNNEATWDDDCERATGLLPTSIAALIRDGCIERGYKTRSYWNIVIDLSGEETLPQYHDSDIDGRHYVGG